MSHHTIERYPKNINVKIQINGPIDIDLEIS